MTELTELSVIVPVYNEAESLSELHLSITEALKDRVGRYEIVLVNDGSKDGSATQLADIASKDPLVKVVHLERNYGQTAAIWAGIKASRGSLLALMDADLQTDPCDLFRLMPFIGRIDCVCGRRSEYQGSWNRKLTWRLSNRLRQWITGDKLRDAGCPLKLFKREVADSLILFRGMHRFLPILAQMNGYSVIEVAVKHRKRKHGRSKYGVVRQLFAFVTDAMVVGQLKKRALRYRIKDG